jgi:hypothetical protein
MKTLTNDAESLYGTVQVSKYGTWRNHCTSHAEGIHSTRPMTANITRETFYLKQWEQMMIDDQVNLEELEESKKRRAPQEAAAAAEADAPTIPATPVLVAHKAPKQWIREARKWLGAGGRIV